MNRSSTVEETVGKKKSHWKKAPGHGGFTDDIVVKINSSIM